MALGFLVTVVAWTDLELRERDGSPELEQIPAGGSRTTPLFVGGRTACLVTTAVTLPFFEAWSDDKADTGLLLDGRIGDMGAATDCRGDVGLLGDSCDRVS